MNTKTLKCIALAALVSTPVVAQIYVAPEGSDEHGDGSMAAPFASLSAARDHLRSIGPAGETVIVRGGTYYLEQPILFDERDNGTSATPVTYRAADNEQPVFIGGTRITGWTAVPGTNYYKAHVGRRFFSLFENDERGVNTQQSVEVVEWGMTDVVFSSSETFPGAQGEFYYQESSGDVYYWPHATPIENQHIVAAAEKYSIAFMGSTMDNPVKHIQFRGMTVKFSDFGRDYLWLSGHDFDYAPANFGMVHLQNAEHIHIIDCKLYNAGLSSVILYGYAQHNTIENCIITGAGHNNVYVCGYPITNATMNGYTIEAPDFSSPEESYVNKSNTVTNNLCSQSGRLVVGSYGILLYQSGENSITHKGPGSAITATILFRNGRTRVRT
jgi:hypothetical protein